MHLIHEATIKHPDGLMEIHLFIVNEKRIKGYKYYLQSEYKVRKFLAIYNKGRCAHGRALVYLKENSIKPKKGE